MTYRPLREDEDVLPGDWWPSSDTDLGAAPHWFNHPQMGRCFRIDASQAKVINDWIFCGYTTTENLYRDEWEDF